MIFKPGDKFVDRRPTPRRPPAAASHLNNMATFKSVVEKADPADNVVKYVFDFENAVAETVLYKYPTYNERTVICCSTQSGCPIGCRFCGAGDYFVRSFAGEEIVAQVEHCFTDKKITPSEVERMQIMFMSMGEPLLNPKGMQYALQYLYQHYPNARLLISTSAPAVDYDWLMNISKKIPTIGLQFSVHESTDEARDKLIPFKKKLTLQQMGQVGKEWAEVSNRRPFFNYCVHGDNNTNEDVQRLMVLFPPEIWEATLSVVCERDESIAAANERQRSLTNDFMKKMIDAQYSTRMFDPAGQDTIGGGCGQLWYVQDWMKNHPTLARPSIGNGLEKVHTPRMVEEHLDVAI